VVDAIFVFMKLPDLVGRCSAHCNATCNREERRCNDTLSGTYNSLS
jgi:hypothetical protein